MRHCILSTILLHELGCFAVFFVIILGLGGCGEDNFGVVDPAVLPAVVSFEKHIAPRMNYYCVGCHNQNGQLGNAGGWNLEGYWRTRLSIESIEKVSFEDKSMPPGGARRMTSWDAALFRKWREEDYPE